MKRTSVTAEDNPMTPEQIQEYYNTLNEFYTDKNPLTEVDILTRLFRIYDRNGDGRVTASEMKVIMNVVYPEGMSDFEVGTIINQADLNGDSYIDIEEFSKMMRKFKGTVQ